MIFDVKIYIISIPMATRTVKQKKVCFYKAVLQDQYSMENILNLPALSNAHHDFGSKTVELKYLQTDTETGYLRGIISTTRTSGIPPKHKTGTNDYNRINLEHSEGLAYANVFLFDPNTGVLAYELNKFGATIGEFEEFVLENVRASDRSRQNFTLDIQPVLGENAYARLLDLAAATKFRIKVASPVNILAREAAKRDSVESLVDNELNRRANQAVTCMQQLAESVNGAQSLEVIMQCKPVQGGGLYKQALEVISQTLRRMGGSIGLVKKIEVEGKVVDVNGNLKKAEPINLLSDFLSKIFTLDEPRRQRDLQTSERKEAILNCYREALPTIQRIFQST